MSSQPLPTRESSRRRSEAGAGYVSVMALVAVALAVAGGVIWLSRSLDRTLCEQSASVRALGAESASGGRCGLTATMAPPSQRVGAAPAAAPAAGEENAPSPGRIGALDLGLAFATSAGLTLYEGLRQTSDLVNPFSTGFVGNRINQAGLALLNLALDPEEQLGRERAALARMWGNLENLTAYTRDTLAGGSGLERASLAGLLAGAIVTPLPQGKLTAPLAAGSALARSARLSSGSLSVDLKPGKHTVGLPAATTRVSVQPDTKATIHVEASEGGKGIDSLSLQFSKEVRVENPASVASKFMARSGGGGSLLARLGGEALGGSARVTGLTLRRETLPNGTSTLRPQIDGSVDKLGFAVPIEGLRRIGELLPGSPLRGDPMSLARQGMNGLSSDDALWLLGSLARMSRPGARLDATVDPRLLGLPARGPVQLKGTFTARGSARGPEIQDSELEIRGGGLKGKFNFSGTLEKE